jgi:RNA polymerase sigma-70 factor, ECF subfamily
VKDAPEADTVFRVLYDRYRLPLFGYVLRSVGGDHQYAEDIVQETMVRAWQRAAELDVERAGRWLFTVARHLIISGHRRRASRVAEVPIAEREFEAEDDEIDRILQAWQVAELIQGLSRDHRQVIIELFFRRLTVSEAAKTLCIPVGTVKSRSHYALHALRAALEEQGVTGP